MVFLLRESDVNPGIKILRSIGYAKRSNAVPGASTHILDHESALPLCLQTRLFRFPHLNIPLGPIRERASTAVIAGEPVLLLSPADHLVHILGHASSSPGRNTLLWACDARFLIQRCSGLNWQVVLNLTLGTPLALPLFLMLCYLRHSLHASVPVDVLQQLFLGTRRTRPYERDLLLHLLRTTTAGGIRQVLASAPSAASRMALCFWSLFPSPAYLSAFYRITNRWALVLTYPKRPLHLAVKRLIQAVTPNMKNGPLPNRERPAG